MRTRTLPAALALLAALLAPAAALELSLEENKSERGATGFVDMQRVFNEFPETRKAKQDFEKEFEKRDADIRARKKALFQLRLETDRLEARLDFLKRTPLVVSASSETAKPYTPPPAAIVTSSRAVILPPRGPTTLMDVAASTSTSGPAGKDALAAAQAALESKQKELAQREAELRGELAQAEKDLGEIERRKTQALLAQLYEIVRSVAREEGVSVVMDKSAILYGHEAVDLTPKVVERLKLESEK